VILLDTSVVSAVLRRRRRGPGEDAIAKKVAALLTNDEEVVLPGIVFQEVLSGVAERLQQEKLLASVRESFPIALATEGDHLMAADLTTQAARRGVALSIPDALIAAQAINRRAVLFTLDTDFESLVPLATLKLLAH
jgi:predicted nucleic acid-binding protein